MFQPLLARRATSSVRSARLFATRTTPVEPIVEQDQGQSEPARPAAVTPLPGASVLPEAFRAAAETPTRPTRDSLAFVPSPSTSSSFSSPRSSGFRSHPYKLSVLSTRNNTILTLSTSPAGANATSQDPHVPIAWVSAGSAGYKGAARGTYDAAVEVSLKMFQKIKDLIEPPVLSGGVKQKAKGPKPTELEVVWKGFGQGRDAVFRSLMGAEGDEVRSLVKRVTDATPLKIGGTRAKKRRVYVAAAFVFSYVVRN
ncbi:mitochondrial 37S ribosomal protein uS11m MRPS18 [Sporobolomyces koalae]|uniref:mitochondrial 37S ribosomal protein uS11m MRPS18 n=1 Tax=Sporobolomyces koalae TaxID=500713 RepID=UPI003182629E